MPMYHIHVETLGTATCEVEAAGPDEALAIAKRMADRGDMDDDPLEYDWPTARVSERTSKP
jgi:hypothetical protein